MLTVNELGNSAYRLPRQLNGIREISTMCEKIWNLIMSYSTSDLRNIATVMFYAGVLFATYKTYQQAKMSIFSNERNEVFKVKLDEILRIYRKVSGVSGSDLTSKLNYFEIINSNIRRDQALLCINMLNKRDTENISLIQALKGIVRSENSRLGLPAPPHFPDKTHGKYTSYKTIALQNGLFDEWGAEFIFGTKYHQEVYELQQMRNSMLLPDEIKSSFDDLLRTITLANLQMCIALRNMSDKFGVPEERSDEELLDFASSSGLMKWAPCKSETDRINLSAGKVAEELKKYLKDKGLLL